MFRWFGIPVSFRRLYIHKSCGTQHYRTGAYRRVFLSGRSLESRFFHKRTASSFLDLLNKVAMICSIPVWLRKKPQMIQLLPKIVGSSIGVSVYTQSGRCCHMPGVVVYEQSLVRSCAHGSQGCEVYVGIGFCKPDL